MALITTPSTEVVIGCAIRVHTQMGPGLYESVYQACLGLELNKAGLRYAEQAAVSVTYDGIALPPAFRADFIVEEELIVEIKSLEQVLPVHQRQVLTYLRLSGLKKGLLINFNVARLKDGLRSFVM
jgi:GxxExxY protein